MSLMSHELRTPLTNIRSYAETIRDAEGGIPRETEDGFLDIIINEADRMTHIVQDLLTLSRLDSGRTEMVMARFAFGDAIVCPDLPDDSARKYVWGEIPETMPDADITVEATSSVSAGKSEHVA